ncbi:hypothetical protein FACS189465_0630 [Clostridia bacterium]|nr:hypothetical protein FACS189465_0630 [Clostridia bacterium]
MINLCVPKKVPLGEGDVVVRRQGEDARRQVNWCEQRPMSLTKEKKEKQKEKGKEKVWSEYDIVLLEHFLILSSRHKFTK